VVGERLTYRQAGEQLDFSPSTVLRYVRAVRDQLKTDLDVKEPLRKRRRRKRKLPGNPTETELATLAGLLTVDPVTAVLARKAAYPAAKLPPKHPGAMVTVTQGSPRCRVACATPFGTLAYGLFAIVCAWWRVRIWAMAKVTVTVRLNTSALNGV
jgi:hypothetical protein